MEDVLKAISKCLQAMMNDMSRDEVIALMEVLKTEKEALVRVRAQLPARLAECHQVCINTKNYHLLRIFPLKRGLFASLSINQ